MVKTNPVDDCVNQLQAELPDATRLNAPVGSLTTYRVGGRATALLTISLQEELEQAGKLLSAFSVPLLVIGRGSNMLVSDEGFSGVAVQFAGEFSNIEIAGEKVNAGCAVPLPILARRTVSAALTGLEWAVGVPGSVGGAVFMNAGGHGSQMSDVLNRAQLFSFAGGRNGWVYANELGLGYRHSNVSEIEFVVKAEFSLQPGKAKEGEKRIEEIVNWRRTHQPGGQNAGSVFRNPEDQSAGAYIEQAGLKGFRIGSAYVHEKHANFIQAEEGGEASDVKAVIDAVREKVFDSTGVQLETEVRLIGFEDRS